VLLLDEPLARLDTLRREAMRVALKRHHQEKPATTIYVTQDQMEAMSIADRIVVMCDGQVEQAGAPIELFERPASRFVAGFFGPLKMNFLVGTLMRREGGDSISLANSEISVPLPPNRLPAGTGDGGGRAEIVEKGEHLGGVARALGQGGVQGSTEPLDRVRLRPDAARRQPFQVGRRPLRRVDEQPACAVVAHGDATLPRRH